jgi:hypothetical protein
MKMKMTANKSMVFVAVLAMSAGLPAQTSAQHKTNTVTAVGTGQGEGTGVGFGGGQTSPTAKDDLFAGTEIFEKNATDVTEITMDPDSLAQVTGKDKPKAQNTVLQVVRTYEYDKPGMYNMADVDKFRERLNTGDWHCSIHTRSLKTGESTDVCNKRRTDDLYESAIITVEPKELTFIHTISHHPTGMMMPGMGELGVFPGGLNSLTSLATLDPEMLELRMQLNTLKSGMGLRMNMLGPKMMVIPNIDGEELEKSIEKGMKGWDKGIKDWDKGDGVHTIIIGPGGPEAPPAPAAAPTAPEMPTPPAEAAPVAPAAPPAPAVPHEQ